MGTCAHRVWSLTGDVLKTCRWCNPNVSDVGDNDECVMAHLHNILSCERSHQSRFQTMCDCLILYFMTIVCNSYSQYCQVNSPIHFWKIWLRKLTTLNVANKFVEKKKESVLTFLEIVSIHRFTSSFFRCYQCSDFSSPLAVQQSISSTCSTTCCFQ